MHHLIDKFLNNTISEKELEQLWLWSQEPEHRIEFETYLRDQSDIYTSLQKIDFQQAYTAIREGIEKSDVPIPEKSNAPVRPLYARWAKYAAVFVGILGIAYGFFRFSSSSLEDAVVTDEMPPQITLELEDGTVRILNETSSGVITNKNGKKVVSQNQNTLLYPDESDSEPETLTYNQLTIPLGKKFQLVLSDGSHVFLNSGSKLRYPTKFLKGLPRDVFLDGEAYFVVEKDEAHPFTVITDEMNTRVLGTKFNVSSYKNENNTASVLVEGSIEVYDGSNEYSEETRIAVTPGQRAVFKENDITVDRVDIQKYIAWTEGKLYFVDDRFELILKELERHFNVVINNTYVRLNDKLLTGTFETENLEQILNAFQAYSAFEYIKEGNVITIKEPK